MNNKKSAASVPTLMFQGTSSNAGKSLICAGVCRILANAGYRVAPFKAQNMSLNSCVTGKGEEMSRAQWLQARAAKIPPDARMNPVLLKPLGDRRSEVIVMGKSIGVMSYGEYVGHKRSIWESVVAARNSLAAEADLMIIEGAGSPAEINLREHDIANMGIAHYAKASVILIADIDRGGAFASLAGTMALLSRADRRLIKGFLLNKFRGEVALLDDALTAIESRCRRPFFGVVPMFADLRLPEEDSVSFKENSSVTRGTRPPDDRLDIACLDLPSISNFTDLDPFLVEPDVASRTVSRAEDLGRPDLLLIPGSRNIGRDLEFLLESGLFDEILNYASYVRDSSRGAIAGICGGLQLMGISALDPSGDEAKGEARCLGLLPVRSRLHASKITRLRKARVVFPDIDLPVSGYEIHRGITRPDGQAKICVAGDDGERLGFADSNIPDKIWGAYLHGIFENDLFRRAFLEKLRARKDLPSRGMARYDPEAELDRLAQGLEKAIDIRGLLHTVGVSVAKVRRL